MTDEEDRIVYRDQRDAILITAGLLLVVAAIVHATIAQSYWATWTGMLLDPTTLLLTAGTSLLLSVGWVRYRILDADQKVNVTRSAYFSWWLGLATVLVLIVFVYMANLVEDGLRDLALLGSIMVWSWICMSAPAAWWVAVLTSSLLLWTGPAPGYIPLVLIVLALSRIIPITQERVIQKRIAVHGLPLPLHRIRLSRTRC